MARVTVDIDYNKMAAANASLPTPVLPVEAFYNANQTFVDVTTMASHG